MPHPLAGKLPPESILIDPEKLVAQYYATKPDPSDPLQRVAFGTSGHRGSASRASFNEAHIVAMTQAICELRKANGVEGPLYLGVDTHALSAPAQETALEVLAANGVTVLYDAEGAATPTPVISHAILVHNRDRARPRADGIVITPSHNPPEDGGFKYNPPHGGPADTNVTAVIEKRANELLSNLDAVARTPIERARKASSVNHHDFVRPYVDDLQNVIDMQAIRGATLKIGADPLGGSNLRFWAPIAAAYGIAIDVVNATIDPTFRFMPCDHDGKIRMDCSSPYAMANLVALADQYDLAFGNDTDSDRHGIVTRSGLMNPNHYLAVAIAYLFQHREGWRKDAGVGKTLVSSSLIDRVARHLDRRLVEVPVGFKWFVDGLLDGSLGFGGEESAGASFLRRDGTVWSTDKDGIILDLLAVEILASTGKDPSAHYRALTAAFGAPIYTRIDAPATPAQKSALKKLSPDAVRATSLAGDSIVSKITKASGNDIGGLKVSTDQGWFAARPSGTEDVYKIYAESFRDEAHLAQLVDEAKKIVSAAFAG